MLSDSELIKALNIHSVALERNTKGIQAFMASQRLKRNESPSNVVYGMYYFNQGSNANVLAQWRQILPRNLRRMKTRLISLNQTLFISSSDNGIDIPTLIKYQQNGFLGAVDGVAEITMATGVGIEIEGTDAIYAASLTGAGSTVEQAAYISWVEQIYSDVEADPRQNRSIERLRKPGEVEKLTVGLMNEDDDQRAMFSHDGVR